MEDKNIRNLSFTNFVHRWQSQSKVKVKDLPLALTMITTS